jgi:hypothetical protein
VPVDSSVFSRSSQPISSVSNRADASINDYTNSLRYLGLEELPNAIGVLYTSSALGNLVGPVIAGILLDSTAPDTSYLPLQLFCCLTTILSSPSILWLRFLRTRKIFVRV